MSVSIIERLSGKQDVEPGRTYLSLATLIDEDHSRNTQRTRPTFSQVQDTLTEVIGHNLPDSLVQKLQFDQFHWIGITHSDAYSALFIGIEQGTHRRYEIEEAQGTIEIARQRWGRLDGKPSYLAKGNVRVAGVYRHYSMRGSTVRPMAVDYRETSDCNSAQQILVGVRSDEISEDSDKDPKTRLTLDIPSNPQVFDEEFRRQDVGLITPVMVDLAAKWNGREIKQAIRIRTGCYSDSAYSTLPRNLSTYGFYSGIYDENMTAIGYDPDNSFVQFRWNGKEYIKPPTWGITLPLTLHRGRVIDQ
jgi:hypothetical protein